MSNHELVFRVDTVEIALLKSNPPQLRIVADGFNRTGGYKDPRLVEVIYVTPPADGIWEYTFEATPPNGLVPQVLTPVTAMTVRQTIPSGFKGVRVKAASSSKEALLDVPIHQGA